MSSRRPRLFFFFGFLAFFALRPCLPAAAGAACGGHRFFYDRNLLGQVHTQITVKDSDHIRIIPDNYLTITRTFSPNTGFSIITIISKLFQ